MLESNKKIIELINNNVNVNEIVKIVGLTHKQLYYRLSLLKFKGYDFYRKYYSDGSLKYSQIKELDNNYNNGTIIRTEKSNNKLSFVFISDLHITNKKEDLIYINMIYDFCVKNNINIIINAGDLVDGLNGNEHFLKVKTYEKQIEYILKKYPFDKNILNFICLGNHDIESLLNEGQDIKKVLETKRHDLIPIGYGIEKN